MKMRNFLVIGFGVFVLSFFLLIIGVKGILHKELTGQNLLAFATLSIIFGGISARFIYG